MQLAYETHGPEDAESTVILLHGFPLDRTHWRPQAHHLAQRGYRAILPDLRGHGESGHLVQPSTMERCAEDVVELADSLGIERFWLGGLSMGGYVALALHRQARERVAGLLLADTRAEPDTEEAKAGRRKTIAEIRVRGMDVLVETMLPKLISASTRKRNPGLADSLRNIIRRTPSEGAIHALEGIMMREDQRPHLPSVGIPTLIVVGAEDAITPPAMSLAMAKAIPGSQVRIVTGAGHLAPLEAPEPVNHFLDHWLKGFADVGRGLPRTESTG